MAKPAITKRVTKGSALTYSELDTNFQNLADATYSITVPGTAGRTAKTLTTTGAPTISTASKQFGAASLSRDISDTISVATSSDFAFGTGNFTIEMWIDRSRDNVRERLIEFRTADIATVTPMLEINSSNQLCYLVAGTQRINGGTLTSAGGWYHIAVSRSGTTTKLFVDGTQVGSSYTDTNNYTQHALHIGNSVSAAFPYNGYIDELRISKGTARYTTTFTPSATAFVNDSTTVLLCHFDTDFSDDVTSSSTVVTQDLNGTITFVEGGGINIVGDNTAKTITLSVDGGGGLGTSVYMSQLSDDPAPTLGGALNTAGWAITSESNGDITIDPDGTGVTYIKSELKVMATTGAPTTYENGYYEDMLQTPVSWLKISLDGTVYYIPLFQ